MKLRNNLLLESYYKYILVVMNHPGGFICSFTEFFYWLTIKVVAMCRRLGAYGERLVVLIFGFMNTISTANLFQSSQHKGSAIL